LGVGTIVGEVGHVGATGPAIGFFGVVGFDDVFFDVVFFVVVVGSAGKDTLP